MCTPSGKKKNFPTLKTFDVHNKLLLGIQERNRWRNAGDNLEPIRDQVVIVTNQNYEYVKAGGGGSTYGDRRLLPPTAESAAALPRKKSFDAKWSGGLGGGRKIKRIFRAFSGKSVNVSRRRRRVLLSCLTYIRPVPLSLSKWFRVSQKLFAFKTYTPTHMRPRTHTHTHTHTRNVVQRITHHPLLMKNFDSFLKKRVTEKCYYS